MPDKRLSVIIVSYNTRAELKDCILSIRQFCAGIDYEIIVVDNGSADRTVEELKRDFKDVILIENRHNVGYAAACNIGVKNSDGKYVLILNSDVVLLNPLKILADYMEKEESVGIAGCAIYDGSMRLGKPLRRFPAFFSELYKLTLFSLKDPLSVLPLQNKQPKELPSPVDTDWVEGAFIFTRREVLDKAGRMDERFFFYYEDTDLCYSVKKKLGLRVVYYPAVKIKHLGGRSTKFSNDLYLERYYKSSAAYLEKHKGNLYAHVFSTACVLCWTVLLMFMKIAGLVYKNEAMTRKCAMLSYVIKNRFARSR